MIIVFYVHLLFVPNNTETHRKITEINRFVGIPLFLHHAHTLCSPVLYSDMRAFR